MTLALLTSNLALIFYALASVLYLLSVQKTPGQTAVAKTALAVFSLATVAVSYNAVEAFNHAGTLTASSLLLTAATCWLALFGHIRFKLRLIGAIVAPLATLILLMHFFVTPGVPVVPEDDTSHLLVDLHVALAVLGQAFAILACAVSVFYLWQQNLLKKKRLSQMQQNLPAIDRIDQLLRLSLWTGFIFITLGLLTGAIYTQVYAPPATMRLSAKVIWATGVWLWYLATLLAKNVFNRPSKRIAQMCLAGFVLLAFSYFGMGFLRAGGT